MLMLPLAWFADTLQQRIGETGSVRNKPDPFAMTLRKSQARALGVGERTIRKDYRGFVAPAGSPARRNANKRRREVIAKTLDKERRNPKFPGRLKSVRDLNLMFLSGLDLWGHLVAVEERTGYETQRSVALVKQYVELSYDVHRLRRSGRYEDAAYLVVQSPIVAGWIPNDLEKQLLAVRSRNDLRRSMVLPRSLAYLDWASCWIADVYPNIFQHWRSIEEGELERLNPDQRCRCELDLGWFVPDRWSYAEPECSRYPYSQLKRWWKLRSGLSTLEDFSDEFAKESGQKNPIRTIDRAFTGKHHLQSETLASLHRVQQKNCPGLAFETVKSEYLFAQIVARFLEHVVCTLGSRRQVSATPDFKRFHRTRLKYWVEKRPGA